MRDEADFFTMIREGLTALTCSRHRKSYFNGGASTIRCVVDDCREMS